MLSKKLHQQLDRLGIGVSVLCAVHCALLPLIITALPLLGLGIFAKPIIEVVIIFLSLIIGISSLSSSWHRHKNRLPAAAMVLGFTGIFSGHFVVATGLEWIFLAAGGLLVATAHYLNWQLLNRCKVCDMHL